MNALDNWKQPYKYNTDGTWEPYPIPELENVPDNTDWLEFLRSKGFERRNMIGGEFSAVQVLLYDHKQHGCLIEVFSGEGLLYGQVICADPPALMCFVRDFSPMFNLTLSTALLDLIEEVQNTVLDDRDGIEVVQRVNARNSRERRAARAWQSKEPRQ
jgi:hypothetical protein